MSSSSSSSSSSNSSSDAVANLPAFPEQSKFPIVTLQSADGIRFHLPKNYAEISGVLKSLLNPPAELMSCDTGMQRISNASSFPLMSMVRYMAYKMSMPTFNGGPEFPLCSEIVMDILLLSNFMDI